MRRTAIAVVLAGLLAVGGGALAFQEEAAVPADEATPSENPAPDVDDAPPPKPAARTAEAAPAAPPVSADTPMAERVAVLGVLNKRNGLWRDVTLRPGEAIRLGDLVVRLRACETTAPWEPEKLTGAFVQAVVRGRDAQWRRIFSGWLYKESPSLNVVEHPIYDIWPKSCTMRHPDVGPDTVSVTPSEGVPRSSAKKSDDPASDAQPEPGPTPSAPSSNAT